jgi:hypothetical protein
MIPRQLGMAKWLFLIRKLILLTPLFFVILSEVKRSKARIAFA